jgi:hypothetical protein
MMPFCGLLTLPSATEMMCAAIADHLQEIGDVCIPLHRAIALLLCVPVALSNPPVRADDPQTLQKPDSPSF